MPQYDAIEPCVRYLYYCYFQFQLIADQNSGGIVRNLFSPVLSGGSTILCSAFDPNMFWDILEEDFSTWYYASPSMHMAILAESNNRLDARDRSQLRLICNAAGGLLPALASRLKETFGCAILPSYGMTECMPISTPPLDYDLNRAGTSGISCGPEISVRGDTDRPNSSFQVGRIAVRGGPTFKGYSALGSHDKSTFNKSGWFDTGDLGYMDNAGYLYITGRGKEVINRGGEIISPFEVEEAITIASQSPDSPIYSRLDAVLAFSVPHEALQEVVGVVLVPSRGQPRPDIRQLHAALSKTLHPTKCPVVIVYMDALPTSNNKALRMRLGDRLGFESIMNDLKLGDRHFEAKCPPINSPLTRNIPKSLCVIEPHILLDHVVRNLDTGLEAFATRSLHDGLLEIVVAQMQDSDSVLDIRERLSSILHESLDGYLIPSKIETLDQPFPRLHNGLVDEVGLDEHLKSLQVSDLKGLSHVEREVRCAFSEVLLYPIHNIKSESDFFALGGDSLSAGRLLSVLRRKVGVRIPVNKLFSGGKVSELATLVEQLLEDKDASVLPTITDEPLPGCTQTYSSTNPLLLVIQLIPIVLIFPMKLGLMWTCLIYSLSTLSSVWPNPAVEARFLSLIASMAVSRLATQICAPMFGILFKWLIIGRYCEGIYPMWGPYHTRWWLVQKVLQVCGKVSSLHSIDFYGSKFCCILTTATGYVPVPGSHADMVLSTVRS